MASIFTHITPARHHGRGSRSHTHGHSGHSRTSRTGRSGRSRTGDSD